MYQLVVGRLAVTAIAALATACACKGSSSRDRTPGDAKRPVPLDARIVATPADAAVRPPCEVPDEPACLDYALALAFGTGMPADLPAAVTLLEASCARSYMRSCVALTNIGLPAAQTLAYGRHACTVGEDASCGRLVGLFNDKPLGKGQFTFARDQLARRCRANVGDACWVMSGLYWLGKGTAKDRAKAGQYIERACQLAPVHCDVRDRWKSGGGFFEDLGDIPTIDVLPFVDPHEQTR